MQRAAGVGHECFSGEAAAVNGGTSTGAGIRANRPGLAVRVFVPFALGYFLSFVFRTVTAVLAPDIVADTGIDAADLGLLTSVFFLSFALAQLPLGLALDRFGPRRVEASLLVVAAAGCLLFAYGTDLTSLAIGRAAIGLGMSACLMASFKAFVQWFESARLPLVNAALLAVGATGAMAATTPVEWALSMVTWRELFLAFAGLAIVIAVLLIGMAPRHPEPPAHITLAQQWRGLVTVFRDRYFWRLSPVTVLSQGAFLSYQGLWAGPWLRDVAGLDRGQVAIVLLVMAGASALGFLGLGSLATRLYRRGVRVGTVAAVFMTLFIVTQAVLLVAPVAWSVSLWVAFAFLGTAGTLPYAALSQHFHGQLAGRANSALNLLVFVAAFLTQWGIGLLLAVGEDATTRTYATGDYQLASGVLVVGQVAALAWFWMGRRGGGDVHSFRMALDRCPGPGRACSGGAEP